MAAEPITKQQLRELGAAGADSNPQTVLRDLHIKTLTEYIRKSVLQVATTGMCEDRLHDPAYIRVINGGGGGSNTAPKTAYFFNAIMPHFGSGVTSVTTVRDISADVIEQLRELFSDCLIEYRETKAMDGRVIESGIIVDWS